MKNKFSLSTMFIVIFLVGLVISILNGDFQIGSYIENLGSGEMEIFFEVLSFGLGFLALTAALVILIIRLSRKE
jgi:hypothetical protein